MRNYENEYISYASENREYTRYLSDEKDQEQMSFAAKAGIAAVATVGAIALGRYTGATNKLSNFLQVEGKAFTRAFRESRALNGNGFQNVFSGDFVRRQRAHAATNRAALNQFSHRRFDMQNQMEQANDLVENKLPTEMAEQFRYEDLMDTIRAKHGLDSETFGRVDKAMQRARGEALHSDDFVRRVLHEEGVQDNTIQNNIIASLNPLRKINYRAKGATTLRRKKTDEFIERTQASVRALVDEQLSQLNKGDNFIQQAIKGRLAGERQATVNDILSLQSSGRINLDTGLIDQMQQAVNRNNKFGDSIFDTNVYVKSGRDGNISAIRDYEAAREVVKKQANWLATTNIGHLFKINDIMLAKRANEVASFRMLHRDTVQPVLNDYLGKETRENLGETFVYAAGKVARLFDDDVGERGLGVKVINSKNLILISSRYGTAAKMYKQISGVDHNNENRTNFEKWVKDPLDLDNQIEDSVFTRWGSIFTKFNNPEWERNIVNNVLKDGFNEDSYYAVSAYFRKHTEGLSAGSINHILREIGGAAPAGRISGGRPFQDFINTNNLDLSNEDDLIRVFEFLGKDKSGSSDAMKSVFRQYSRGRQEFLSQSSPVGESTFITGEFTKTVTGVDRVRQEVSLEIMRRLQSQVLGGSTGGARAMDDFFKNMRNRNIIDQADYEKSQEMILYQTFRNTSSGFGKDKSTVLSNLNNLATRRGTSNTEEYFQDNFKEMAKRKNSIFEEVSTKADENPIHDDYILMSEAFEGGVINKITSLSGIGDLLRQVNPFAGRNNMKDVTALSLMEMYIPYRLQDSLNYVGLGMSGRSMSSTANLVGSLFLKRGVPVVGIPYYAQYFDDKYEDWTGESISDRYAEFRKNDMMAGAKKRTEDGTAEELKREMYLRPGIEQWGAMPSIHLPGETKFGVGSLLSLTLAGGTPIDKRDTYTEEEMQDYFENGVDVQRKSKWWLMGSKSAYQGEQITEFRPNFYKMAKSDWEYSSVTSTKAEKYGHSNLPTLENPFGILTNLVKPESQQYWWEEKHYYDRPYMLSGSMFNPNTFLVGDIGNATIGQIAKPVRKMHEEYWEMDPVELRKQKEIEDSRIFNEIKTSVSPSGRRENYVEATVQQYGGENLYYRYEAPKGTRSIKEEDMPMLSNNENYSQQVVYTGGETGSFDRTGEQFITKNSTGETVYLDNKSTSLNLSPEEVFSNVNKEEKIIKTTPREVLNPAYDYKKEAYYKKLEGIQDPTSFGNQVQEGFENWTEPAGIWKFMLVDQLAQRDPYKNAVIIQKADAAYNMSNQFWESNMGSFGSELSEIGRRFIRRDSAKIEWYNPIRNTMPDWMPGSNYFIDFKSGDPYGKITGGEYRLPGESYEMVNKLHSDETGRYGAFDKFKILADVAPWSEEYKFWRDYVTENIKDEDLRKQVATIKDQVSERKKKKNFTNYRFKDAVLDEHEVTVTKFLDDYTFLTEEFGDQAFRMAGVQVKGKAEGVLQQYFNVGDKVTVGIAADPVAREPKDTYGTVKAVVYDKMRNVNNEIIRRGWMKENEADESPTGIRARFTNEEINKGRRWENFAHADTPLNTKFMKVRSPVEDYERDAIYGVEWANWDKFLFEDYIVPGAQNAMRYGVFWGGLGGAVTGGLTTALFIGAGPKGRRHWIGAGIGAAVGIAGGAYMQIEKSQDPQGKAWRPERRIVENEINEYFDKLKYMKFHGLYMKSKEMLSEKGIDLDAIEQEIEQKNADTKEIMNSLKQYKKDLYINQPENWKEENKIINSSIKMLRENKEELTLPEEVRAALRYKDEAESTMYGVDPYGDREKIMKALPHKDKAYFNEFVKLSAEDQTRILEVLPDDVARIYKAIWGYGLEDKESLDSYFLDKYLPDANWEGWSPQYDLDSFKLKTVKAEGLDLPTFNFWGQDELAAQQVGSLGPKGNTIQQPQLSQNYAQLRGQLEGILKGYGLKDVSVNVYSTTGQGRVNVSYQEDVSGELDSYLSENMEALLY
jgi:hypothetical protein